MPQLHFREGHRALFVHVLRAGRTVLGRSDRCDVALPSESVSRVHCTIEGRPDGWLVRDRSRHGTKLNGAEVDGGALQDGDELQVGDYTITFVEAVDPRLRSPTATAPLTSAIHEELVEGTESGVALARAQLRVTRGPHEGRTIVLKQVRTGIGGPGAEVELDAQLPRGAAYVRVVRGRPMIEPGHAAVFLAGTRVREITPALRGEEVRIGEHGLVVELAPIAREGREIEVFGEMVGHSAPMRRLFGALSRIAAHDAPVLLVGESGTGKELAARALHGGGPTADGPFVAINCAAIAQTLVESELFGHEKGAFTGASSRQDGAFHHADGGTLFLDEIGEMKIDLQAKLLRALESGEVRRVGSGAPTFPDVRVVAATNRNLVQAVKRGAFRQDLYFRLAVLTVRMPPLRERRSDIGPLAAALLARHHPGATLTSEAVRMLETHDWPGNVRELRNVLTRAVVMSGEHIAAASLTFNPWAFDDDPSPPLLAEPPQAELPERARLVAALAAEDGNRTRAARALGFPRSTLLYKMRKHGID